MTPDRLAYIDEENRQCELQQSDVQELIDAVRGYQAAISAEREACAMVADEYLSYHHSGLSDIAAAKIAAAIRARSQDTETFKEFDAAWELGRKCHDQ